LINLIRVGDDTDHGGKVVTGSSSMRFDGRYVARKGDEVSCPQHPDVKPNVIEEGDATTTDNGVPIARHGHRATLADMPERLKLRSAIVRKSRHKQSILRDASSTELSARNSWPA
jgi:uncharacterized Zn-binding protein involved in type VI secretion